MLQAKVGDTVTVHYTGKLQDGTVFDSSDGREPLAFQLGAGQVIPGFEQAIVGMSVGDSLTQNIPCAQAYGPRSDEMAFKVDRQQVPPEVPLQLGLQLQLQDPAGNPVPVMVVELTDEYVVLDANHPLAGEDLTFEIELVNLDAGPSGLIL